MSTLTIYGVLQYDRFHEVIPMIIVREATMTMVTMEKVKELRQKTAVGLMDCKKALEQAGGDMEKAIELLRQKGASIAAKRAENETNQGIVSVQVSHDYQQGAAVVLACETDFAANTKVMQEFITHITKRVLQTGAGTIDSLTKQPYDTKQALTIDTVLHDITAKISEKIKISHVTYMQAKNHSLIQSYVHAGEHIGVLIHLQADKPLGQHIERVAQLGKDLCMQITVTNPLCIEPSQVDEHIKNKERTFIVHQLEQAGKPANMIEKITEGKLNKFYEQVCLLNQKFIKDTTISVQKHIEAIGKQTGLKLEIVKYTRLSIGNK